MSWDMIMRGKYTMRVWVKKSELSRLGSTRSFTGDSLRGLNEVLIFLQIQSLMISQILVQKQFTNLIVQSLNHFGQRFKRIQLEDLKK